VIAKEGNLSTVSFKAHLVEPTCRHRPNAPASTELDKGGRGHKGKALETSGFSRQRLGQARAVLAHSPELALAVRDGSMPLDKAVDQAYAARNAVTSKSRTWLACGALQRSSSRSVWRLRKRSHSTPVLRSNSASNENRPSC
jgi:hypothetical protein